MALNTLENFKGMQDEVLNYGFNDGPQVNRSRIKKWLNEAQWMVARKVEAPEFQQKEEITLVKGQFKYTLPTRFTRVQDVYYPEMQVRLRRIDLQQFDMHAPKSVEGPPALYTVWANELWVFPTPTTPVTGEVLEMHYVREPAKLVEETDEPELNGNYWYVLTDYAVMRAYEAEDDTEMAQYWAGRYQRDLDLYATDVQWRMKDRPDIVDGSWVGSGFGNRTVF